MSIVAFGANSWYGPWLNRQHIMSRMGRHHCVIYTQGPYFVWDRDTKAWASARFSGSFDLVDNVFVDQPPKFLFQLPNYRRLDDVVKRLVVRRWKKQFSQNSGAATIAYLFHPKFYPFIRFLSPDLVVYHAYDLFAAYPDTNPDHLALEQQLVRDADVTIASTAEIAERLANIANGKINVIENGADYEAFSSNEYDSLSGPPDIATIPRPRIGYVGNLNIKVDFPLLHELAQKNPTWNFVLVGGIHTNNAKVLDEISRCDRLSNIHFVGERHHDELPAYCQSFDINLMCYRTGEGLWSDFGSPLKLFEYLSTGRPVISSGISAAKKHSDVIAIADTYDEWHTCINTYLASDDEHSVRKRQEVACQNSWDIRVKEISDLLACHLN